MKAPAIVMVGDMPDPVGGVAQVCVQVCRRLQERGLSVHFIDTEPSDDKRPPSLTSYRVLQPGPSTLPQVLRSPRTVAAFLPQLPVALRALGPRRSAYVLLLAAMISQTVRRSGASVILAHHAGVRGLAALVAGRATGTRVAVMVHGAEFTHPGWAPALPVARRVVERADLVVTPSEYTKGLCLAATARSAAIDVVYNGVEHERFHLQPSMDDGPIGEHLVLFVGHLHARKGPTTLASAIPLVTTRRPVRYLFVGPDLGELPAVRRIIEEAGVSAQVELRGQVDDRELPALYGAADVLVFPTVWATEGFGLVAAEAMACGTPVVASDIAAIPEVVTGDTGLLFEPGNPIDLAAKLTRLLDDDELRRHMGEAAVRRAAGFTWDSLTSFLAAAAGAPSATDVSAASSPGGGS